MRVFNRYVSQRHLTAFTGELLVIFGSMTLVAHAYRPAGEFAGAGWQGAVATAVCLLCLYYNDLYDLTVVRTTREIVIRLFQAVGSALILIAILYLALPSLVLPDGAFLPAAGLFLLGILAWRLVLNQVVTLPFGERILIVGTDDTAQTLARLVLAQRDFAYEIVGFITDDPRRVGEPLVNPRVIGTPADIERLIETRGISRIFVGIADRRGTLPVGELLRAKLRGVRVEDVSTVYERMTGKLLVEDLRPSWLIFSDGFRASRLTRQAKRVFDLVLATVGLIVAAPLMLLTAAAVWLESVGAPILYRQERVGQNGRVFTLYKFRSMRPDAEQGTPVWARAVDDRVTRVGGFIRMTRLDELPQLWNVLRGDMSFVGPRPERPFFVSQLVARFPLYEQRHAVRPGITGWAQVKYRYGASMEDSLEKLRYDLYYVKHLSLAFDLTILFDTVKVVLFAKGAR